MTSLAPCFATTTTTIHARRHNTGFVMDTDRSYAIGQVRALERKQRLGE
jgi:hypothetical protein